MAKPTMVAFETRYSDDSGVEYGVRFDSRSWAREIVFESCGEVAFPSDKIEWLIDCLCEIKKVIGDQS